MWNVRLRGPRGQHVVLKVDPDTSFKTFSELAVKELGLKASDSPSFRRGFPPRVVEADGTERVKSVFEANDTVVVGTNAVAGAPVQASAPLKKAAAKPKRAIGKKAAAKASRGGVHTLNPPTSAKKRAPPKRKIAGSGHQLGSSLENNPSEAAEVEGASDNEPQRKYRRSHAVNLTSKEDVEIALVSAVSGQSNDRAAKFFRAATKNAVEHQYEITLANARLNAALSHNFEMEELSTVRRADGSAAKLRVRFKETPRKWKEEMVDLVKKDELQAILKYVLISGGETGREMLKPFNMAQVSTRVFWGIAHLYGGDVAAGLADLVPDEDWSFLDTRTRVMSEKAMEAQANEEHYKLWKQGKQDGGRVSPAEADSKAKASKRPAAKDRKPEVIQVDSSDEKVKQDPAEPKGKPAAQTPALSAKEATPTTLRGAAARAALARFDRSAQTSAVVSAFLHEDKPPASSTSNQASVDDEETESEEDVEEATTVYCDSCKKARILSSEEAENAELDKDPWTCASLANTGRSGGCDAIDNEVTQITGASIADWLRKAGITTRQELADASVGSTMHALVNPLDPSAHALQPKLEKFIDEARLDEVNDWMSEIVGDARVVQRLEVEKLGTPADLLATPSDLVLEAAGNAADVSLSVVSSWQSRAQQLVDEHPWLAEWRTL